MEFVIILLLLGDLIVTFLLWQKNQQQTDQAKTSFLSISRGAGSFCGSGLSFTVA